ncbi:MAG: Glu/Leu/Phe/Val dehydrogenase dimerization domain-containing protein [Flavobacteriales bacterium]
MQDLLEKYEDREPEIVFEWKDPKSEARGWVVINSLRGGAAGGGTRMRKGLDRREVVSLAKTMEVKFTVSGPPIGGAKSGIAFDPNDPRKQGVLERWYAAVMPLLRNYYGTGGDMNVDEMNEVIPITSELGLQHPQEGIVNGHFQVEKEEKAKKLEQLREGVSMKVNDPRLSPDPEGGSSVADLITGYGVAHAAKHHYELQGASLEGKRVIVQGWGNVAATAAHYAAQEGARIVGIIDKDEGLIPQEGMGKEAIHKLFLEKEGNKLRDPNAVPFQEANEQIWDLEADVFLPCAGSRLVTKEQVDRMRAKGLETIVCGANVPFADPEIFFGPITEHADHSVALIPDFIANCGMARVFAYCMSKDPEMSSEGIFHDVSNVIRQALERVRNENPSGKAIAHTAFRQALEQLT